MKKRLLFVYDHIEIGGAGKVFLNILSSMDLSRYEVTVASASIAPAYQAQFPADVKVIELPRPDIRTVIRYDLKHLRFASLFKTLRILTRLRQQEHEFDKLLLVQKVFPDLPGTYDCAIAFVSNYQNIAVLAKRVTAKRKATWIHISLDQHVGDTLFYQRMMFLDRIFCVSQLAKDRLDALCPTLKDKTQVLYNLVDVSQILAQAEQPTPETLCHTALVTVGRLSAEKGQDMIPCVTRMLLDACHDVHWYLVGDGPLREKIETQIHQHKVEDRVILLGTKTNPYPYIKNCDIYVQTSLSEGWCLTTQEAKILKRPVVTTNLPVMSEQFISGYNGIIADGISPEALARSICLLLERPELRRHLVEALADGYTSPTTQLHALYDFIENRGFTHE